MLYFHHPGVIELGKTAKEVRKGSLIRTVVGLNILIRTGVGLNILIRTVVGQDILV